MSKIKETRRMILIFALLLVAGHSLSSTTVVVRQNYPHEHRDEFHTLVYQNARVVKVKWCSTLFVPRVGETPRDIMDCHASALLKLSLQPDQYRVLDSTLTIEESVVSGFWLDRPSNIVIYGELADGTLLEQVVRINHKGQSGDEGVEQKAAIPIHVPVTKPKTVMVPIKTVAFATTTPSMPALTHEEAAPLEFQYLMTIIGSIALMGMLCTIGIVILRRKTVLSMLPANREYRGVIDELENVSESEKTRQAKEDFDILTSLGKGANASFYANL